MCGAWLVSNRTGEFDRALMSEWADLNYLPGQPGNALEPGPRAD